MATETTPPTHPKLLKNFNTWLVGGFYVGREGRNAYDPKTKGSTLLDEKLEQVENERLEKLKTAIAARQRQLRQERANHPTHHYVPRLLPGNRSPRKSEEESLDPPKSPDGHSRSSGQSPPTSPKEDTSDRWVSKGFAKNAKMLQNRQRMKNSLIQESNTSVYRTLFPPLFTPYNRTPNVVMNLNAAREVKAEVKGGEEESSGVRPPPSGAQQPPQLPLRPHVDLNELSCLHHGASARPRVRMATNAHAAFMPTGSSVTAYRTFTNYRLALGMMHAAMEQSSDVKARQLLHTVAKKSPAASTSGPSPESPPLGGKGLPPGLVVPPFGSPVTSTPQASQRLMQRAQGVYFPSVSKERPPVHLSSEGEHHSAEEQQEKGKQMDGTAAEVAEVSVEPPPEVEEVTVEPAAAEEPTGSATGPSESDSPRAEEGFEGEGDYVGEEAPDRGEIEEVQIDADPEAQEEGDGKVSP